MSRRPSTLTVRELRTGGKILVTTLLCPKTNAQVRLEGPLSKPMACRTGFAQHQDYLGDGAD